MSLIRRLFPKAEPVLVLHHPVFGQLRFHREGTGWQNSAFTLWSFCGVDLQIAARREGPTAFQTQEFIRFRDAGEALWPRCLAAVEAVRAEMGVAAGAFRISGLSIPSFGPEGAGRLWTLWLDLEGDDHFGYGVQTQDGWQTIAGFADD